MGQSSLVQESLSLATDPNELNYLLQVLIRPHELTDFNSRNFRTDVLGLFHPPRRPQLAAKYPLDLSSDPWSEPRLGPCELPGPCITSSFHSSPSPTLSLALLSPYLRSVNTY